jgi:hypothetical protein
MTTDFNLTHTNAANEVEALQNEIKNLQFKLQQIDQESQNQLIDSQKQGLAKAQTTDVDSVDFISNIEFNPDKINLSTMVFCISKLLKI